MTSREATKFAGQPLSRPFKGVTKSPCLFAEDENTSLAGKTDFPYLAIFLNQDGVIGGFGAAVFPPPFGFGNDLFAFLHGGFVSVNFQTVLSGPQIGFEIDGNKATVQK